MKCEVGDEISGVGRGIQQEERKLVRQWHR